MQVTRSARPQARAQRAGPHHLAPPTGPVFVYGNEDKQLVPIMTVEVGPVMGQAVGASCSLS